MKLTLPIATGITHPTRPLHALTDEGTKTLCGISFVEETDYKIKNPTRHNVTLFQPGLGLSDTEVFPYRCAGLCKRCGMVLFRHFYPEKCLPIEDGEWYYMGNIITRQDHPHLPKYWIQPDSDSNHSFTANTFKEAKQICRENPVDEPKVGLRGYL